MRTLQRWLESAFETFLFNARLVVILAVVGSLTSSVLMFVRGVIVIWHTAKDFFHHFGDGHGEGEELSIALISSVDSFLFATVLLIFAMGIYELFISKIDPASRTEESRPNWLQIHSLDDLKSAVGKVILMILIVRLFESAVKMKYEHPLHLLYLGLAVLFVAGALFLQHASHKHEKHAKHDGEHHEKPSEPPRAHHHRHSHERVAHGDPAYAVPIADASHHAPSMSLIPVLTTARHHAPSMQPAMPPQPAPMPPTYPAPPSSVQHHPQQQQAHPPHPAHAPSPHGTWDRPSQQPFPGGLPPRGY